VHPEKLRFLNDKLFLINNDLVTKHFKHTRKFDDILEMNIDIVQLFYGKQKLINFWNYAMHATYI